MRIESPVPFLSEHRQIWLLFQAQTDRTSSNRWVSSGRFLGGAYHRMSRSTLQAPSPLSVGNSCRSSRTAPKPLQDNVFRHHCVQRPRPWRGHRHGARSGTGRTSFRKTSVISPQEIVPVAMLNAKSAAEGTGRRGFAGRRGRPSVGAHVADDLDPAPCRLVPHVVEVLNDPVSATAPAAG